MNKIQFSSQVKGDAKENNPRDQVNIMTDNKEYVEKFKLLVDEMDVINHPVTSLFATLLAYLRQGVLVIML